MAQNNDIATDQLEKKVGSPAIQSNIAGLVYIVYQGSFGIVDLNGHGQLTGSMDVLPILIEELQGLIEVYGK
jgi:hypothetical protein